MNRTDMAEARGDRKGDRELLRGMLQGREEAFDAFFSRFFPPLYRFALARVDADANAAEEIVQATLSRAISRISTFRGEAALLTWLCTFCRHEITWIRTLPSFGIQWSF
jgi:RNA polymerase sigma-70 factor (ECF subfamily)